MIALAPIIFQFAAVLSAMNKFIDTLVEVDVNFSGKNGSNAISDVHYFTPIGFITTFPYSIT